MKDIIIADPAGNVTAFVMCGENDFDAEERTAISKKILAEESFCGKKIEQVGFIKKNRNGIWHLEMMGGEFCGNAARSAGLICAKKDSSGGVLGSEIEVPIKITVSGASGLVSVDLDTENNFAEVEIPPPLEYGSIKEGSINADHLPFCIFEGISHIIAHDVPPLEAYFYKIKKEYEAQKKRPSALGVMFFDTATQIMKPAVYVYSTESLVFESSCASGSAAFACLAFKDAESCDALLPINSSGGTINVRIKKTKGKIEHLSIGGIVNYC
ncbi:MAG: diaminopimelate epimerase [Termitinemataceae bacterium]|nr:MAG: diaminopimelate epimerase [Termitinemataceae bacterium]